MATYWALFLKEMASFYIKHLVTLNTTTTLWLSAERVLLKKKYESHY